MTENPTPPEKRACQMCGGKLQLFTGRKHAWWECVHCDYPCGLGLMCKKCITGVKFDGVGPKKGRA